MKTSIVALVISILLGWSVSADFIYDVDFENPPHVTGQPPVYGGGTDRPSSGQLWSISDSVSGFGSQVAFVDDAPDSYAFMWFSYSSSGGVHSLSWQWELVDSDPGQQLQSYMSISRSTGPAYELNITQDNAGNVAVYDVLGGTTNVSSYSPGSVYSYNLLLDLETSSYDFSIDGAPVLTDRALSTDLVISSATFERPSGSPRFAIDNFQWSVIPEPSTVVLMVVGGFALVLRRMRRRT